MKANVKSKQQQLYNKYSNHVTKWLIIKHMTCVHDLHLKPYLPVYKNLSAALAAQLVNRDKDLIATTDAYHRPVRVHAQRPGKGLQAR